MVVEGGLIQFAPGTSAGGTGGTVYEGGPAGSDIKTVEVKTGGENGNGTNIVESGN